jgi:hypothetical protein
LWGELVGRDLQKILVGVGSRSEFYDLSSVLSSKVMCAEVRKSALK